MTTNNHRKKILDNFYQWINDNINDLPDAVCDVTAEIWNIEEECEFWRLYASKLKRDSETLKNNKELN